MIGLDTKVLVRYIMQDDTKQSAKVNKLIESLSADKPGFIPLIAIVELMWVRESCFHLMRDHLVQALDAFAYQRTRCPSFRPGDEGPAGVQGRHG